MVLVEEIDDKAYEEIVEDIRYLFVVNKECSDTFKELSIYQKSELRTKEEILLPYVEQAPEDKCKLRHYMDNQTPWSYFTTPADSKKTDDVIKINRNQDDDECYVGYEPPKPFFGAKQTDCQPIKLSVKVQAQNTTTPIQTYFGKSTGAIPKKNHFKKQANESKFNAAPGAERYIRYQPQRADENSNIVETKNKLNKMKRTPEQQKQIDDDAKLAWMLHKRDHPNLNIKDLHKMACACQAQSSSPKTSNNDYYIEYPGPSGSAPAKSTEDEDAEQKHYPNELDDIAKDVGNSYNYWKQYTFQNRAAIASPEEQECDSTSPDITEEVD